MLGVYIVDEGLTLHAGEPLSAGSPAQAFKECHQHWILANNAQEALRFTAESYGCTQGQFRSRFPEIAAHKRPDNEPLEISLPDGTTPTKTCGDWVAYFKREHEAGNLPCIESLEGLIIASTAWEDE